MSLAVRQAMQNLGPSAEGFSMKELVNKVHERVYWKPVINEETGKVLTDEEGNEIYEPVDRITAKQSFKDATDVNKILERHQIKNMNSHLVEFPPEMYGEFLDIDLLEAHEHLDRANLIFSKLPSEVRKEFGNVPANFIKFAADPNNNNRLGELLPALAEPGSYFPNPVKRGGQGAGAATAPRDSQAGGSPASGGSESSEAAIAASGEAGAASED